MDVFSTPSFFITYAVIQTVVFLLLVRFLDLYEHEPFTVLSLMALWGAVGATALSAIGNGIVSGSLSPKVDVVFGNAISAPAVEELAKGLALVGAFVASTWAHRRFGVMRFGGLTDGLVYGAAVGLGFAFTEDIHFLMISAAREGLDEGLLVFVSRRDFFGMGMLRHAIYTASLGAGIGLATWARGPLARAGFAVAGFALAITLHAVNNGLVQLILVERHGLDETAAALAAGQLPPPMQSTAQGAGVLVAGVEYVVGLAFVVGVAWWLRVQRQIIRRELVEEVDLGLIDARDVELVPTYGRRIAWYWQLFRVGEIERLRVTRRLHIELARLALAKWRTGKGSGGAVEELAVGRQKVANLKAQGLVDVYAPGA